MYDHLQVCSKQLSCSPEKGRVALSRCRTSSTDSNIKDRKIKEPSSMGLPKAAVGPVWLFHGSLGIWRDRGEKLGAPGWTWPLTDGASAAEKDREQSRDSLGSARVAPAWSLCSISLQQSARWSLVGLFSAKQAKEIESRS